MSDLKKYYDMFAGKQTDNISFRCTKELKALINELAQGEGLSIKEYLLQLVIHDHEQKYQKELEELKIKNGWLIEKSKTAKNE